MKSALTAAISSGGEAAATASAPAADTFSFPQLRDPAKELTAEEKEAYDAALQETANVTPIGSMPTSEMTEGMVSLQNNWS